ncbi:DUF2877 domain-containing protein [Rubrivivax gelatinosus]|uniref:DUF2877 domain-containing protein n=2 Tax=Rubrivivax gelatinosus TaxID=28068 RepID=I0HMJ6_RUBGI|nr:DUF2877 domain-containing protein [Rubrivivax gelatinosus]BAL94233.1 hypothetical protein RGE_08920 [Rubrivivax gelatinosus IL144]
MSTAFAPRSTVLALSEAAARALDGRVATVVALHRRGLSVVLPGGEPIFVGPPGAGLLPLHVVVRREAFEALRGLGVGARLRWDLAGARRWRLGLGGRLALPALDAGVARLAAGLRARPPGNGIGGSQAEVLAGDGLVRRALQAAADGTAAPALVRLVGRGAGSTPAGDDVLIGALAHGWLVDGADSALRRALLPQREALGALTTPLGAAYLRRALDGVFGSHLIQLCRALPGADERLDRRAGRVAQHGASSGIDTLLGFVAAHELRR